MNTVDTVVAGIHSLSLKDLETVAYAVQQRRTFLGRNTLRSLQIHDVVEFNAGRNRGGVLRGTVEKINIKNVKVRQKNTNTVWNVPANMLTRVEQE